MTNPTPPDARLRKETKTQLKKQYILLIQTKYGLQWWGTFKTRQEAEVKKDGISNRCIIVEGWD